jgi:hypothetical protein
MVALPAGAAHQLEKDAHSGFCMDATNVASLAPILQWLHDGVQIFDWPIGFGTGRMWPMVA